MEFSLTTQFLLSNVNYLIFSSSIFLGKYVKCKESVGFCIPGFQTFHIASGNYKKFGKEYGKKLDENSIVEGKTFSLLLKAE